LVDFIQLGADVAQLIENFDIDLQAREETGGKYLVPRFTSTEDGSKKGGRDFSKGGALLAALGAGLATLLSPDVAQAATSLGETVSQNGFFSGVLAALGLGTAGVLAMTFQRGEDDKDSLVNKLFDIAMDPNFSGDFKELIAQIEQVSDSNLKVGILGSVGSNPNFEGDSEELIEKILNSGAETFEIVLALGAVGSNPNFNGDFDDLLERIFELQPPDLRDEAFVLALGDIGSNPHFPGDLQALVHLIQDRDEDWVPDSLAQILSNPQFKGDFSGVLEKIGQAFWPPPPLDLLKAYSNPSFNGEIKPSDLKEGLAQLFEILQREEHGIPREYRQTLLNFFGDPDKAELLKNEEGLHKILALMMARARRGDAGFGAVLRTLPTAFLKVSAARGDHDAFRFLQRLAVIFQNREADKALLLMPLDSWISAEKSTERTLILLDAAISGHELAQWTMILERPLQDPFLKSFFKLLPKENEPWAVEMRKKMASWDKPPEGLIPGAVQRTLALGLEGDPHAVDILEALAERPNHAAHLRSADTEILELSMAVNWHAWGLLKFLAQSGNAKAAEALERHRQKTTTGDN
jgi:hypothetical protein